MSADNGIYIGEFPNGEFRVIEAMAIDNISYNPDTAEGFVSKEVVRYFGHAGVSIVRDPESAWLVARNFFARIPFVEYGISTIKFPRTIEEYEAISDGIVKGD